MRKNLFIDIETFGDKPENEVFTPKLILPTRDNVKIGNVKDPDKIEAIIKEKLPFLIKEAKEKHNELVAKIHVEHEKEWRGNALKSLKLNVIALSYAFDDEIVRNIIGDEESIFTQFNDILEEDKQRAITLRVIAHYGKAFDYPIIRHRAMKYGLETLYHTFTGSGRYDPRIIDTHEMFAGTDYRGHYSMDDVCKFFGIQGKKGMKGSEVHDHYLRYLDGNHQALIDISNYCGWDVEALRNMYNVMRFEA